jgi:uncharacterized membrane protein HdeD (DUF308 family)
MEKKEVSEIDKILFIVGLICIVFGIFFITVGILRELGLQVYVGIAMLIWSIKNTFKYIKNKKKDK